MGDPNRRSRWITSRLATLDRACERIRDDPRTQRRVFVALLALRALALIAMYFHVRGVDSIDLEYTLFLRFVAEADTLGFASGAYRVARGYWHGPLSYAFYSALLDGPNATLAAGRAISVVLYLVAGLVWYLNVRLLFPRELRLVGLAAFLLGPSWHTIQVRPYALYLLLVVCIQYFAAVLVTRPEMTARAIASAGLAAALALGFANHLYAGVAFASVLLLALFVLATRRELATAGLAVAAVAIAASVTAPWFVDLVARHFTTGTTQAGHESAAILTDPLGYCLARSVVRNALFVAAVVGIATAWWQRRAGAKTLAVTLACAALGRWPFVVTWVWVAHLGERLRERATSAWIVPLVLGALPCSLEYCRLEDNYLTGFRNLVLLPLVDLLVRGRSPRVRVFALLGLGAYLLQLAIWTFLGMPFGGDSPH